MPTAAAKKSAPNATVQETVIRKEVREPVEIEIAPPPPPLPPPKDFWKYLEHLTTEDWKLHQVNLYRYPLGQPKPQKLGRYLRTYKAGSPLLNEEQIAEEFGGGQYDALLKGPPEPGADRWTILASPSWEIDGPSKTPPPSANGSGGSSELAATLQVVLQNLQSAQKSANPASDPALTSSIALIKQLTDAVKPQGITELVQGLASLQALTAPAESGGGLKETLTLLHDFGVIGGERVERKSLASELKEIMEISGMMGGGGGKPHWATSLVENLPSILEKVTPIADKFADAARNNARVAELRSGRMPAALPVESSPPARTSPVRTIPAAAAPAAESPAARIVAPPETEPAAATPAPAPGIAIQPPNLDWVKAKAVQMFAAGGSGDFVAEFLDTLDTELGNFLGSMDEPKFEQFVKTDPILAQIATAPRFPDFVRDFVGYFSKSDESAPEAQK